MQRMFGQTWFSLLCIWFLTDWHEAPTKCFILAMRLGLRLAEKMNVKTQVWPSTCVSNLAVGTENKPDLAQTCLLSGEPTLTFTTVAINPRQDYFSRYNT